MRTLRYLPLVAVAGVDGFALFIPYLALIGTAAIVMHRARSQQPQPIPATN